MFGSCTEATPRDENCRAKLMLKLILLHTLHVLSKFVSFLVETLSAI